MLRIGHILLRPALSSMISDVVLVDHLHLLNHSTIKKNKLRLLLIPQLWLSYWCLVAKYIINPIHSQSWYAYRNNLHNREWVTHTWQTKSNRNLWIKKHVYTSKMHQSGKVLCDQSWCSHPSPVVFRVAMTYYIHVHISIIKDVYRWKYVDKYQLIQKNIIHS